MGGKSTLQSAVLGSKQGNTPSADLHSWQGLTEVLRRGKESLKDPAAYAEFRNLVLEYAQQGGDPELRKQIDATISQFGTHTASEKSESSAHNTPEQEITHTKKKKRRRKKKRDRSIEQAPHARASDTDTKPVSVSTRRVPPSFRTPPPPTPTQPQPKTEPPPGLPVEPKVSQETKTSPAQTHTPNSSQPREPVPQRTETSSSAGEQEEKKVEPLTPAPVIETPPETTVKSADEYKARIAEIKRLVHEKIGNPATLVDTYAERGKEYMMALLAALKATGPGSPESPVGAMARLERAYETLLTTPPADAKEEAEAVKTEEEEAESTLVEEVTSVPTRESVPKNTPREEEKATEEPTITPDIKEKKKEPPVAPSAPEQKEYRVENETPRPLDLPNIKTPSPQKEQTTGEEEKSEAEKSIEERRSKLSPASTLVSLLMKNDDEGEKKKAPRALHEIPPERVASSVHQDVERAKAEAPEVPKPKDTGYQPLNGVDPAKVAVKQSELSSPEVTKALHQLLEEWSLFKNSGLFGIGPSGAEHPLYQKLAPLSMAEVVSGRWEGSDRKVTANIKEYVNAWRHEQGVAYNIQETFEHFLRRVVLRIQKRQANQ